MSNCIECKGSIAFDKCTCGRNMSEHKKHNVIAEQTAEIARLKGVLTAVANIAHHGGLTGLNDSDIRRLTFPYWDMVECERLQLSGGG